MRDCLGILIISLLLTAPVKANELGRLFTSPLQREFIEQQKLSIDEPEQVVEEVLEVVEAPKPDIVYQGVVMREGQAPLLWLNQQLKPVTFWLQQLDQLGIDTLRIKDMTLHLTLTDSKAVLRPGQVYRHETAEVIDLNRYQSDLQAATLAVKEQEQRNADAEAEAITSDQAMEDFAERTIQKTQKLQQATSKVIDK